MRLAHPEHDGTNPVSGKPCGKHGCTGRRKNGPGLCDGWAIKGTDRCRMHSGTSAAAAIAKGAVVTEVLSWGFGDQTVDPGETLLRLVTQSAARAQMYAGLLQEAYEAAERLRRAHDAQELLTSSEPVDPDDDGQEPAAIQTARADLERVFATGGVAALIGHNYAATPGGSVYASGEAIRGLAKLEAEERDRCAQMAAKAVAAGLAERQVRLAEKQAGLVAELLQRVLADPELGLSPVKQAEARTLVARHLRAVAG